MQTAVYASMDNKCLVEFTWSLARANVHPKADSVKGGEQLGAFARWASEHKKQKVSSIIITNVFTPTASIAEVEDIVCYRRFYLSEEQHRRGLLPQQTAIHPPLWKTKKELGTDCVSNLFKPW